MKRYYLWQAIYLSFYSKKLYQDVAREWGGQAFLYLLLLVALSAAVTTYQLQHWLNETAKSPGVNNVIAQWPVLVLKEGKISTPEPRPYTIVDPDTQKPIAMIDTTGRYTTLQQAKTDILITQTSIITQSNSEETKTYTFPKNTNVMVQPQVITGHIKHYLGYAWIGLFCFFLTVFYVGRLLQALVYALIGKIFCFLCRVPLGYVNLLQIAMVAITPALLIALAFEICQVMFPFQLLFYFLVTMLYLFYGVLANQTQS